MAGEHEDPDVEKFAVFVSRIFAGSS